MRKTEREIKEIIPFTIAMKRIKYLGISLPKETKDQHTENYETLMKEKKDGKNREIKETIPFTIATKRIKYLGIYHLKKLKTYI